MPTDPPPMHVLNRVPSLTFLLWDSGTGWDWASPTPILLLLQSFSAFALDEDAFMPAARAPGRKGVDRFRPKLHLTMSTSDGMWIRIKEAVEACILFYSRALSESKLSACSTANIRFSWRRPYSFFGWWQVHKALTDGTAREPTIRMPPQPTVAQIRLNNIITCLGAAVDTLEIVSDSLRAPFFGAISVTMRSLLEAVQNVKKNRDDCTQMLERIHEVLYGILSLHITSDTGGEFTPDMLHNLAKVTETLHKIHTFVEAQQETSRIKNFFRQSELNTLLKGCHRGLEQALEVFKIQGFRISSDVTEMQQYAQKTHKEVLDLISALSDEESSDRGSSISRVFSNSQDRSSSSLSMLPSEPKIFHGRTIEVSAIVQMFNNKSPRITILGPGGMGKTSLARAVLHHPDVTAKYHQHRVFVACDAAASSVQLAAMIGAHVGLKPGKDLTRPVIHHFANSPPSLLILDNLETIWEPKESRGEVEKFLALLTDVLQLALIITMRGAERPANVQWTHPFLEPLKPLTQDAARKMVVDIVDDGHALEDIDKILLLADNMPLVIDLIAHLVDYEGFASVLHRWEIDKTSLLSEGHDKGSNLDLSISLSLASPRMMSLPQTRDLLSLLSILPEGISDTELVQSKLPVDNILACKATLLQTSLAYTDDQKRLKALVPIREYVHKMHPPVAHLVQPLLKYFQSLLELYRTHFGTVSCPGVAARIAPNFVNIQNILGTSLHQDNPDLVDAIYCTCHLDYFKHLVNQALGHMPHFDDLGIKCIFYAAVAEFYQFMKQDIPRAVYFSQAAVSLSISSGSTLRQAYSLHRVAWIEWQTGCYSAAQVHALESQRLARISADLYIEANALHIAALCSNSLGSYTTSIAPFQQATDLLALCGLSGGELDLIIRSNQAESHRLKSEYVEALNIHAQILPKLEQDPHQHSFSMLNTAQIDVEINTSKHIVQEKIDKANMTFNAIRDSRAMVYSDATRAALSLREGNFSEAKSLLQKCLMFAWGKDPDAVSYCLERLSNVQQWGRVDHTSRWVIIFLVHSLKLNQKLEIHKAIQVLGDVFLADDDLGTAISLFTVALKGFTQMDVHRSRGECMLRLGDIMNCNGDMVKAAQYWNTARPLFERSSQVKEVAYIDQRLAGVTNLSEDTLGPTSRTCWYPQYIQRS
ncbi:hypothetical protein FB451DRAFT_1365150 [Mycena latifolia]|nr:hypothetical protein FB451DRAFT_1365150 [Mycena latifolia]